jgi:hypothetical protein
VVQPGDILVYGGATAVLMALAVVLRGFVTQNSTINRVYREEVALVRKQRDADDTQHNADMAAMRRQVTRATRAHARCNVRLTTLITACVKAGLDIPHTVWADGPEEADDELDIIERRSTDPPARGTD